MEGDVGALFPMQALFEHPRRHEVYTQPEQSDLQVRSRPCTHCLALRWQTQVTQVLLTQPPGQRLDFQA